jgi:hypothetical protein
MSTTRRPRRTSEDAPVTKSGPMPDFLRNPSLPQLPGDCDQLTADLAVLLTRNAGNLNFRAPDLKDMDTETKRVLLADLQRALGIKPLGQFSP